mgnify:CR=1 FL=1
MKKYLFIFLLLFNPSLSFSQDGIYFLDVDLLINKSDSGKKIVLKLKKINEKNIEELESYEKELKKEDEEINKIKNILSKEEMNNKIQELKEKIAIYRSKKDKIFKDYNNLKNKEIEIYFKSITPYIEDFMEENSIKLIMDKKNIFIANSNYDITDPLINFLNKKIDND